VCVVFIFQLFLLGNLAQCCAVSKLRTDEWRNVNQSIYVFLKTIIMYTVPDLKFMLLETVVLCEMSSYSIVAKDIFFSTFLFCKYIVTLFR
jgi:hypothetical protein